MMKRAGSACPAVSLASPGAQPPSLRHSSSRPGPAARWIAPSTPPPPSRVELAALTMASMSSVVMSACRAVSLVVIARSTGGDVSAFGDLCGDGLAEGGGAAVATDIRRQDRFVARRQHRFDGGQNRRARLLVAEVLQHQRARPDL